MLRFTDLFVTVNSNRMPRTADEETALLEGWRDLMENDVWTAAGFSELLVFQDGYEGEVENVDVLEPVIEVGPAKHRVHTHFTLVVEHTGRLSLSRMLTKWYEYIDEKAYPELSAGVNVQFRLLRSSAVKNYDLKEGDYGDRAVTVDF